MRKEYETTGMDVDDLSADPVEQFHRWLQVAVEAELEEPNAAVVSTVDGDGQPWSRYVLLKSVTDAGFDFYTNYESHKSHHLNTAPRAALTIGWLGLRRQVNIAGTVVAVPEADSDAYWAVRPRGSQIGGWASAQSRPLIDRKELLDRYEEADQGHGDEVPRPAHWGGWRVIPHTIEFWQGRTNRLHDRLRYERTENGWAPGRLAP